MSTAQHQVLSPSGPVVTRPDAQVPSYAETQGQSPHDWNAFLAQEEHTGEEWRVARRLAENFVTCAVGNMCASIPRYTIPEAAMYGAVVGEPIDRELAKLGYLFAKYLRVHSCDGARHTLAAIERRSAEILREMAAQP
jgi:hypothetical protein